ncbi:MAG: PhoH family protein [Myxococcota bacterium]|nr:PhoH family protein [Myxococcota bacterium]
MARDIHSHDLRFDDAHALREVSGEFGANLNLIARELGVRVSQRGTQVTVSGLDASTDLAADLVTQLYELALGGTTITTSLVEHATRLSRTDPEVRLDEVFNDVVYVARSRKPIFPRSLMQKRYVEAIRENDVVFGLGPAGTGKTYLAVTMAVAALASNQVKRIILCRPAVEAGEKLGFLPGDLEEKVNPYLRPLYDALNELLGQDKTVRLQERGTIEVAPLAFMRGRTLSQAFVILDEAQNTTQMQMKMLLTRLGVGSKAVITGDLSQIDLPPREKSGLEQATRILTNVQGITSVEFSSKDVVRHRLVSDIIRAYDRASGNSREPSSH